MIRTIASTPLVWLVAAVLVACERSPTPADENLADDAASRLQALYQEYDEAVLELNPLAATFRGDARYNDRWYPYDPLSDEYAEVAFALNQRFLARLLEIDPAGLGTVDRLNYDIFRLDRENAIERQEQGYNDFEALTPISQFGGVPNFLVMLGSGATAQPFNTAEDYDNWLKRSAGFAGHVDLTISKMREGIELGVVQPRILMEKALPQLSAQVVEDPEKSDFWRPVANMPETIAADERARIEKAYREHIDTLLVPAYRKLHEFVRDEYLQHTRETVGQNAVPGGEAYYAYRVRESTTTRLTPEQIHDIGKREANRIFEEMKKVKSDVGFVGDMDAFFEFLRTDEQFYFDDEQALLDAYEALKRKINPRLERLFDVVPKTDYVIRPVEKFRAKSMAAAQYYGGTPDGTRPGIFYVNTYDLASRPRFMMEAVSIHEASPGHHFQVSIAQELEGLPPFRRFGGYTAYSEGWGLYAETLGTELGLYTDPYQYFGALYTDIWRANRLVVDTGLHAMGWSREEAIDWMRSNSPIAETDVVAEVERYIAIPSQALAYKIGQMKIRELRGRAEAALGDRFDVRAFHNQVLTTGSLPLLVLEAKIDRWIKSQQT
jgi:uncharacterized protein (DUF885 family)